MSCPNCGRIYCDCSPSDRGQSFEAMIEDSNRGLPPLETSAPDKAFRMLEFEGTSKGLKAAYAWFETHPEYRWPYRNDPALEEFAARTHQDLPGPVVTFVGFITTTRFHSYQEYVDGQWVQRQERWDEPNHAPRTLFALYVAN